MLWNRILITTAVVGMLSLMAVDSIVPARDNSIQKPDFFPTEDSPVFNLGHESPVVNSSQYTNIDMNSTFVMTIDENGTKRYNEPVSLSSKRVSDRNSTYYQPNNAQLFEMFKDRSKNSATSFVNRMTQSNEDLKEIQSFRGDQLKKQYLYDKYAGSAAVQNMQRIDNLQDRLFATAVKPLTIQCYIKRKMIPKYYCPLNGMSYGARVGGAPEDDMAAAKKSCETFCESPSLGCRNVDTGLNSYAAGTSEIVFTPLAASSMATQTMSVPFEKMLKVKFARYSFEIEWTDFAIDNNLTTIDNNITLAKPRIMLMTSVFREELSQPDGTEMTTVSDRYPMWLAETYGEIALHTFEQAKSGMVMFYPPQLVKEGRFANYELQDIVKSIKIKGLDVQYVDSKYYFCGATQIVNDVANDCKDGVIYDVNETDGFFRICQSPSIKSGPEPVYGAYYSQSDCDDACHQKAECVETYEDALALTGNERYNVSVGCVSDPFNSSCTDDMCMQYVRDHKMPVEEVVYDRTGGTKSTVHSGVPVPGVIRPRIDIDAELAAAASSDQNAYEDLFNQARKDGAYQEMIKKGTYNYSKYTVAEGQPFENASRVVLPQAPTGSYYLSNSVGTDEVWWKLKPASADIGAGTMNLYVVAKIENTFIPESGTFASSSLGSSGTTSSSGNLMFKDFMYALVSPNNILKPFYAEEYAQVQETNMTTANGWRDNETNRKEWYISYDPSTGTMIPAAPNEPATPYKSMPFSGAVNYEEMKVVSDIKATLGSNHALILSQEVVNQGQLPIKHYNVLDTGSVGTLANVTLHGVYSQNTLTNEEVVAMVQSDAYKFYNMHEGQRNKQVINGDGAMQSQNVRMFIKGGASNMTVSAELNPYIEEEGKDATLFMFMFEGGL